MNKKLLTLAVAAAIAAPGLASAEAIMYGKLNQSIDYVDVKNAIAPSDPYVREDVVDPATGETVNAFRVDSAGNLIPNPDMVPGEDFKGWGISDPSQARPSNYFPGESRANRLGVKGSEDLGNGLKAVYQVELGIEFTGKNNSPTSGSNDGGLSFRNSFVGLAGGWGTLLVGRHDTPLKISTGKLDLFSDTMADYNGTVGFDDLRVNSAIAYISPSWNGLQFAGATVGGSGQGGGTNINSDSLAEAYSLALIYKNGPFYGSLAYESLGSELAMNTALSVEGNCPAGALECSYINDDYTKWRIGLGLLDWNGFTLTGIYEEQDDLFDGQGFTTEYYVNPDDTVFAATVPGGPRKQQLWQVQAGYTFGNAMIKAMYGSVNRDVDNILNASRSTLSLNNLRDDLEGDKSTWAIGLDYNFSKRTKAYALYTDVSDDQDDVEASASWSGFSLGMMHSF